MYPEVVGNQSKRGSDMFIEAVRIESLGNTTYVIGSEQSGIAAVIDPVRDVDHYTTIANDRGVKIMYALETHVHNDFVSGARELATQTDCEVGASASGGLLYPSRRLEENDELDFVEFKLRVMHTPGHTPEHISFLVLEQDLPTAIFTGGALMPGGAARVDLLGRRIAPFLARWLHHTIHEKLLKLPDDVKVYPTHGGGSFCSASPQSGGGIPSSIGAEREHNPFVERSVESDFVQFALTGLGSYPAYYKYMADINRRGPDVLGGIPRLASLTPLSAWHQLDEGAILIDSRDHLSFNQGHVPGSFSVPYGDNFSTWVGWVVPWLKPLVFLSADPATNDGIVRQLIRIGYDRLSGFVSGDLAAWVQAGLPNEGTEPVDVDTLREYRQQAPDALVIDVRQHNEYQSGHVQGSLNIELGELTEHLDGLPRELPIVVMCASGMRATIAGSILRRDGRDNIRVVEEEGAPQWIAKGYPADTGDE
ncbi:MAG: rhodanese-like domain-containing protein [Chloroflexi bacterium]|nr:rhodanese-like domain-containing protein [Chloroflexota bacterium]MDA1218899.1 rhodanese-like domain-containing protein [Chloroflexota bacterium]